MPEIVAPEILMPEDDTLDPQVDVRAFGQKLLLDAPKVAFLRADSLWRLRTHYIPTMTARSLAPQGVAVDVGAGFGAFAIPFALTFPDWTVFAFEPDPQSHAALRANLRRLGVQNVVAVPAAIGDDNQDLADPEAVLLKLGELLVDDAETIAEFTALLPRQDFARHSTDHGFMQPGSAPDERFHGVSLPTIPASLLARLEPNLLKLTAPQMETPILGSLKTAPLDHLIGERWSHVDSTMACGADRPGLREAWLPLAGNELLVLRHQPGTLRTGLDVVVAMYNSRDFIEECIAKLVAIDFAPLRVLVVDDGSTDDSADVVRRAFGDHPRVTLVQKPNGGCASARNYGRMMSDAAHIAFVDADDLPDTALFPDLYELARQTGAEVVQAGYHLVEETAEGLVRHGSSESEQPILRDAKRHVIGVQTCHLLPNWFLMTGQPTIWRRVYRRDYLDNRKIWFPEHIRAFDDQVFQLLTLQPIANIPVLDGHYYGYRQHPAQDIKQKDERHFYSLEMFRLTMRRGLAEGWKDFRPVLRAYVNTVNWVTKGLRPDLLEPFCQGAAELWTLVAKIVGPRVMEEFPRTDFHSPILAAHFATYEARLIDLPQSSAYVFLDSPQWQVPMVRAPWDQIKPGA